MADTHTVIWYVFGHRRLSSVARDFIDAAGAAGDQVGFSAITLAEIVYLAEKGRIPEQTFRRVTAVTDAVQSVLLEVPFDRQVAEMLAGVDRSEVPDMPDRIIAATALYFQSR